MQSLSWPKSLTRLALPDALHLNSYENAFRQHDKGEREEREPEEVEQSAGNSTAEEDDEYEAQEVVNSGRGDSPLEPEER